MTQLDYSASAYPVRPDLIDEGMTHDLRYQVGGELGMKHLAPEERAAR